jgi:hypothetical protein
MALHKVDTAMLYDDFTITMTAQVSAGYPVSAVAQRLGRVSTVLPPLPSSVVNIVGQIAGPAAPGNAGNLCRSAGVELYRWLLTEPLGTQLRLAWDRAAQAGHGVRLRLSIDPPEVAALPWELLYDPERDHLFATSIATPLVRYLDQTSLFGGLVEQDAELPLNVLLVLPSAPDLDLKREKAVIEQALRPLQGALNLRTLEGPVTRSSLSDALMAFPYHIVHLMGHGAYLALPSLDQPAAEDVFEPFQALRHGRLASMQLGAGLIEPATLRHQDERAQLLQRDPAITQRRILVAPHFSLPSQNKLS